ncbi:gamma-glutamyltranspeptidase [Elstera cyanobacteriorum]|uniref:Glutathione hydrolase proenzyme n=1 Tax=Elstera cyanobacteriorum TaxID=2022747 RepID=A0A255XT45_9PROT|nr:gamma-glutamyltransferase [Elstera cyanobacteriorum]OYQ19544.1 gamma-glutamyltransferase [Elstera cyanobacteriorum]GFZ92326.1 gamma-glutamyltranspeptidase [Elstera cyanobacteriorum]
MATMRNLRRTCLTGLLAGLLLAPPLLAQAPEKAPEAATGTAAKALVSADKFMVIAANPLASRAGAEVLAKGGTAADAAIAVQLVLNLVEPQSSGIGGGAFVLYYDKAAGKLTSYDGREIAPEKATPQLFLNADGKPLPFYDAVVGGRSVGVPGVPRLLDVLHKRHGKAVWADLVKPALGIAEEGFTISPRLAKLLAAEKYLMRDPVAKAYFYRPNGEPRWEGELLTNPDYAATLKILAEHGVEPFYKGSIGEAIVAAVRQEPNPGSLSMADLAAYKVIQRDPVCSGYRGLKICGMAPPSSGGLAVAQMLGILERYDLKSFGPGGVQAVHLFMQAGRLAFADRDMYVADPAFVRQPITGMLDPVYLGQRAQLIDWNADKGTAPAGQPPASSGALAVGETPEFPSTTQIAIVDSYGNALSMTTTIEDGFGARRMAAGFLLNNQLTDFSFVPERDGKPVANRVEPGKRPRSSMAPTIVFDDSGAVKMVLGSPGGAAIIQYVAQTLLGMIDWGMDPQTAVSQAHFGNRNGNALLEDGTGATGFKQALETMGYKVTVGEMNSGLAAILVKDGKLLGGADPRREGLVVGN